ncbi:MAG: hypothetical protein WCL16_07345 [bacterium]
MSNTGTAGWRARAGILAVILMTGTALAQTASTYRRAPAPAPALPADDPLDGVGLGVTAKIGTLGIGADVTLAFNRYFAVRGVFSELNLDPLISSDGNSVKFDLNWVNYGGLLDWHVLGGGFRLSGGLMENENNFKAHGDLTQSVKINGDEYSLNALDGEMSFGKWAPYLGLGYGAAAGKDGRVHFACDFGVLFQKQPIVTLTGTASDPGLEALLNADLAAEESKIQNDLKWLAFYPVINVGVSVRFF